MAPKAPSVSVFYGSQTGCAESIAKRIYDDALEKLIDATVAPLNDFQSSGLLEQPGAHHVIVVCSTTGNGDPPDNCAKFWRHIKRRTQPKDMLANIKYAVLGLGDTNYDKFCFMGKSIDKRMHELGAERFFEICAADEAMGLEDQVEPWLDGLWPAFFKSNGHGVDGHETASSSDGESTPDPTESVLTAAETTALSYLPENLITYDKMFGPFTGPTELREDVPRLQSSTLTVRDVVDRTSADQVAAAIETQLTINEYSTTHPFQATISRASYLTASKSERKVVYMELDITGSGITYTPGDSIGIKCPNRAEDVDALLQRLEVDGTKLVSVETATSAKLRGGKSASTSRFPRVCSIRDLFLYHVDLLSSPKKAALRALATYCSEDEDRARLLLLSSKSGATAYQQFISDQALNFVELLHLFPSCQPPLDHLISLLPQLMPRFYSIATSPLVDANKLGIAFTVVDEPMGPHAIRRRGLCTNWLETIAMPLLHSHDGGSSSSIHVPLFLRPTRDFVLPASHEWPLLLIGPGTGVAPFMGFLQHRFYEVKQRRVVASEVCTGHWRGGMELDCLEEDDEFSKPPAHRVDSKGIYLFYGCRRRDEDWLFAQEMQEYVTNGTLHGLFTAFSREQDEKYYVQHDLRAQGALVARVLLEQGGYVYVCGDGTQMAKDVHDALRDVLQTHGNLSIDEAENKLRDLATRQRYVRDIW